MQQSLLALFRRSGDAHVGQTLTRLARLAVSVHRDETAWQIHPEAPPDIDQRVQPSVAHRPRTDAGSIHTEVDR